MAGTNPTHDTEHAADAPEADAPKDAPTTTTAPAPDAVGIVERKPDAPKARDLGAVRKPAPKVAVEADADATDADANPAAPPPAISLTPEQYDRFRQAEKDRDALLEAEQKRKDEARRAEEDRLREQGEYKTLLATRDSENADLKRQLADTQTRTRRTIRDRELALALSGKKLVDGGGDQLMRLWSDEFEAVEDGDQWRVQTRDGKTVGEFVRDKLASKQYAHFVLADARGGANSQGTASRPPAEPPKPGSEKMADALKNSFNARHNQAAAPLAGRNRLVPSDNN